MSLTFYVVAGNSVIITIFTAQFYFFKQKTYKFMSNVSDSLDSLVSRLTTDFAALTDLIKKLNTQPVLDQLSPQAQQDLTALGTIADSMDAFLKSQATSSTSGTSGTPDPNPGASAQAGS